METLRGDFFNIKAGGTLFVSRTHKKNEIERVPKKMEGAVESGERGEGRTGGEQLF